MKIITNLIIIIKTTNETTILSYLSNSTVKVDPQNTHSTWVCSSDATSLNL